MKKNNKILLLFFLSLLLSTGCSSDDENIPDPPQAGTFEALEAAINSKMNQHNMPGASIAIIKNEKLVYIKSFGYADKEENEPATNNSLWRIASISKPVTAVAILKLVQDGQLNLNQKVFGPDGILGNEYGEVPTGSNKDLITVRHLIDHKSGWTNNPNDPMFLSSNLSQTQIITEVLQNRPLTYTPGETFFYSNFGYSVLGRVIEKITGTTYEEYVQTEILAPMGITGMKIGGNTLAQRFPNEVKYYQNEFSPYMMNVTRMDSHGGWIASATDLAKFMVRIDRLNSVPDLLPVDILNQNTYFSSPNWGHTGSLPGTSSTLNRLNNTYSFVFLTNTRSPTLLNEVINTIINQIQGITTWPDEDLFGQ